MVLDNHYGMVMDPLILRLGEIANGIKIKITTVTPTPKESDFTMQESAGAAAPYTKPLRMNAWQQTFSTPFNN